MADFPILMHTVLDTTDVPGLAAFWGELLGLTPREGDDDTWTVLLDDEGHRVLALQHAREVPASTWPEPGVPQQLHLDLRVDTLEELAVQRARAEALGARLLLDRSDDEEEPLHVLADPAGHPFCVMVSPG